MIRLTKGIHGFHQIMKQIVFIPMLCVHIHTDFNSCFNIIERSFRVLLLVIQGQRSSAVDTMCCCCFLSTTLCSFTELCNSTNKCRSSFLTPVRLLSLKTSDVKFFGQKKVFFCASPIDSPKFAAQRLYVKLVPLNLNDLKRARKITT